MARKSDEVHVDRDGVRVFEKGSRRPSPVLRTTAALVALVCGAFVVRMLDWNPVAPVARDEAVSQGAKPHAAEPLSSPASRAVREARAVPVHPPAREAAPSPADASQERSKKKGIDSAETLARDMLRAAVAAGETEGIAAFPAPGTNPIKIGLVVPRDFELPEGFLRHYQVTDDGRRLEPVLMFSPDYTFVDASGQPVTLPEDGIVPPDMAPAGLPLRNLRMPENPYGAGVGAR